MKTQRLNVKWIGFWMAALSAGALACEGGSPDAGQPMAGAGGTSEDAGGSPSEDAGGSPSEDAGGSPSAGAGGSPSENAGGTSDGAGGSPSAGAGGSPSENAGGSPSAGAPGDTDVEWHGVSAGSFPGGDGSGLPCGDVEAVLLQDQAELDQWAIDQGISGSLQFIVDWTTESALGAVTQCSTSGHVLERGDLSHDGSGGLTAEFTVTHLVPSFDGATVAWSVFSVEGRAWTSVSATTIE